MKKVIKFNLRLNTTGNSLIYRFGVVVISIFQTLSLFGQDNTFSQTELFNRIKENHPLIERANLLDRTATENVKIAKAGFDPNVSSDWESKQFSDKQYYNVWKNQVNLPTWYGLEISAGYDVADGEFLNPENYLPKEGVGYLGVSANLLQGLIIDERRTNLRLANIGVNALAIQKQLIINDLLYNSGKAYWDWVFANNQLSTYQRALDLAQQRFNIIKQNYRNGEAAGIDTLKAILQVQTREMELNDAANQVQNAAVKLSDFLWENGNPQPLNNDFVAPKLRALQPIIPNTIFNSSHPELQKVELKLTSLQVEERMKREKLKPKLKLKYNLLGQEFDIIQNGQNDGVVLAQNYKAGVQFEMNPILRSERANLELNEIKQEQTNLELSNKRLTLQNKLNAYINDYNNIQQQIALTKSMVSNYEVLLAGEIEKFTVGESDLFIVNTRETQLVEAEIKLLKLLAKEQKILLSLQWINGLLN
ncbi:MAG: TolC family protein [Saprospiraceae bacterium]